MRVQLEWTWLRSGVADRQDVISAIGASLFEEPDAKDLFSHTATRLLALMPPGAARVTAYTYLFTYGEG